MPNTREKLIELIRLPIEIMPGRIPSPHIAIMMPYAEKLADHLIANGVTVLPESGIGDMSDGYHTFNELYHHRAILFSVICNLHPLCSWKAKKHHDGTMYDGMFIVGINTPEGQATYHYDIDPYWDMFHVPEAEFAPTWDGHTPDEAIRRIGLLGVDGVTFATDNNVGDKLTPAAYNLSATAQQWIPVTERLPEYETPVMGWDAELRDMGIVNFVYGQFFDIVDMSEVNVTHWMPLPEPPKGE